MLSVLQGMEVVSVTEVRQELERGVGASVEPLVSRVSLEHGWTATN